MTSRSPLGPSAPGRRRRLPALAMLVAILFMSTAGYAAVTITYNTSSTQSISIVNAPIVWVAGPDSSGNSFVASFALSSNQTYYTITLKPVPEANVTWGNLTTLKNQDTAAHGVTVTGTSVASYAKVLTFMIEFRNYGTDAVVGTLDLDQASPSVNLGSMAAGAQHYLKMYIKLDTGTGAGDLPASVDLSLTVT